MTKFIIGVLSIIMIVAGIDLIAGNTAFWERVIGTMSVIFGMEIRFGDLKWLWHD